MGRSKGVAFVPGRSAYMDVDGRRGASSMRLNFAGVPDEDIREGIRRISAIAGPDTGLMGALTGSPPDDAGRERRPATPSDPADAEADAAGRQERGAGGGARTAAPRSERDSPSRRQPGSMSAGPKKVAVLKGGGSLERTVSLRSGARAQSALRQLGHEVVAIDVGPELVAQLLEAQPDAAFVALHGSDGEDGTVQGLLEAIGIPYTGSGPAACMRCTDKALAKYLMREAGIPTPDVRRLQGERDQRARRRGGAAGPGAEHRLSARRQAGQPGLGAGRQVRALRARSCRGRSWGRSPTTARS